MIKPVAGVRADPAARPSLPVILRPVLSGCSLPQAFLLRVITCLSPTSKLSYPLSAWPAGVPLFGRRLSYLLPGSGARSAVLSFDS